jgi:hypothetical protein
VNHHARRRLVALRHPEVGPELGRLEGAKPNPERAPPRVPLVPPKVFQKVLHDSNGHHVPDVLHVLAVQALERNPDHFQRRRVHHGPAAVARVDGGVGLQRQEPKPRLAVLLHFNAAHDPRRDGHGLAPDGVPQHVDFVLQLRQLAQLEPGQAFKKRSFVFGPHLGKVQGAYD